LKVSLAICFLSGIGKTDTIKLSNGILGELGVSRRTKYRAIEAMEKAGLISVSNKTGSSPDITINRCPIT